MLCRSEISPLSGAAAGETPCAGRPCATSPALPLASGWLPGSRVSGARKKARAPECGLKLEFGLLPSSSKPRQLLKPTWRACPRAASFADGAARGVPGMGPWIAATAAAWLLYPLALRGGVPAACACLAGDDAPGTASCLGSAGGVPVVFSPRYDITACGLERAHPFDSTKYSRVFRTLVDAGVLERGEECVPSQLSLAQLTRAQGWWWLARLGYGLRAVMALELPPLGFLPSWAVWWRVLEPMQLASAGTVCAAELALARPSAWAINLGGGFHHARHGFGHGFCVFNDLTMAVQRALDGGFGCRRLLYLDLDVHQGDGFERDMGWDPRVAVVDAFHPGLFPGDAAAAACPALAERGARFFHRAGDGGDRFLEWLRTELPRVLAAFDPDLVLYNAGSDVLVGDPLGGMDLPESAVCERDAIVFRCCGVGARGGAASPALGTSPEGARLFRASGGRRRAVAMALSGGYQSETAGVVARSIAAMDAELGLVEAAKAGEAPAGS